MKYLAPAAAMLIAASAHAQTLEVAGGDWTGIPQIQARGRHQIGDATIESLDRLAARNVCNVRGLEPHEIDLTIPFLLRFNPQSGAVERLVLQRLGCTELESLMGSAILELTRLGEYSPSGENGAGWYRSELSLSLR